MLQTRRDIRTGGEARRCVVTETSSASSIQMATKCSLPTGGRHPRCLRPGRRLRLSRQGRAVFVAYEEASLRFGIWISRIGSRTHWPPSIPTQAHCKTRRELVCQRAGAACARWQEHQVVQSRGLLLDQYAPGNSWAQCCRSPTATWFAVVGSSTLSCRGATLSDRDECGALCG